MVTKAAGAKITGLLALTMEAQVALSIGDFVHITGDYEVALADGTKPVLGHVSVSNKNKRVSDAFSTSTANAEVPGACTVEARGFYVKTAVADGVIAAGAEVGIGANGDILAAGAGVSTIGIALVGAAAAGDEIDILVR